MINIGEALKSAVGNGTLKSVSLTLLISVGGFIWKESADRSKMEQTVDWHTKAINNLQKNHEDTLKLLQDHAVILARIDGKLDVVNQKIDDDRNYAERHVLVKTR